MNLALIYVLEAMHVNWKWLLARWYTRHCHHSWIWTWSCTRSSYCERCSVWKWWPVTRADDFDNPDYL